MLTLLARHRKTLVAVIGAAVVILGRHFGETSWEYLDVVTLATTLGVYATPNRS